MNFNVSGANFNKKEVEKNASININSNKNKTQTGKVSSFEGVVVSGSDDQSRKISDNTYESLMKQADDVKAQIQASASDAKDNLKTLFKRLSGADAVKIDEDGFNLNDASKEDMVNIVDRIKIELAAHGQKVYSAGAGPSADQIKQVVGSTGMAEEISQKLQEANLPITADNAKEVSEAVDMTKQIGSLSENAKNFLVQNHLSPSIDNVYKAEHMSDSDYASAPKAQQMSEQEWQQLKPQVEKLLSQAGLDVNDQNLNNAKTFLQLQIPVTQENLTYKATLDQLDLSQLNQNQLNQAQSSSSTAQTEQNIQSNLELIDKIVHHMAPGGAAKDTLLTAAKDVYTQVADALNTLEEADYRHVEDLTLSGKEFTIQNLKESIYKVGSATDGTLASWDSYMNQNAELVAGAYVDPLTESLAGSNDSDINALAQKVDSNYIQLQQIRMLMTANAGLFLAKQGIDLNTTGIADLIKELNGLDIYGDQDLEDQSMVDQSASDQALTNRMNRTEANAANADSDSEAKSTVTGFNAAGQTRLSTFQTVVQVRKALYEIEQAPDVTIGTVLKNADMNPILSLEAFAETGSSLRRRYEQAGQTYMAVGTSERKDMGDSIRKALKASTDDILNEIGLENTNANRDAVRILGVNQMEITKENVAKVKQIYSELNHLVDQMKPETVLSMIRDNLNPMQADISEVNEYLTAQNKDTDDAAEKYSKFLYKLDQTGGITSEERQQFIGIYKMMNLFTKDAGAAIGALLKQDADITMSNLCTAYNSRKAAGIDATLDETAGFAQVQGTVNYYNQLFDATGSSLTPLSMKHVNDESAINQRSVENFCEAVQEAYDSNEEEQYYSEYINQINSAANVEQSVIRELERNEQPVTVNNIMAMEQITESGYFNGYMTQEKSSRYVDAIDNREQLEQMYEAEAKEAKNNLSSALSQAADETVTQSSDFINNLRIKNKEIGMIQNLALRHDYRIPYATKDGIGTINLTLVQDQEDTGRISIHMKDQELGELSLEAKITGSDAYIYCQADEQQSEAEGSGSLLDEKLAAMSDHLKSTYGFTNVSVQKNQSDQINRIVYDQAADTIPSDQLYKISKTIIVSLIS